MVPILHRCCFLLLFMHLSMVALGQQPDQKFDRRRFDASLLDQLLFDRINQLRDSLRLPQFDREEALSRAAHSQVTYIRQISLATHTQNKGETINPEKRVRHAGGAHEFVSENVLLLNLKDIDVKTYAEAAEAIVRLWMRSPKSRDNLSNPDFYTTGIATATRQKKLFAIQVMGSEPVQIKYAGTPENAYNIRVKENNRCQRCLSGLDTAEQHYVRQGLYVQNNKIYYHYSDLEHFKKVYYSRSFALAVDIVQRSQFPCHEPNSLHKSPVFDGVMLLPVSTHQVLEQNLSAGKGSVTVEIGEIPASITAPYELNLLIIKGHVICRYITFSPVYGYNLSIMPPDLNVDNGSISKKPLTFSREVRLVVPFEKNKFEYAAKDMQPIYDSLKLREFNIRSATILAYASVEGDTTRNAFLQQKRAESIVRVLQSYQLDSIKVQLKTEENWLEFRRDVRATPYSYLDTLRREQVKQALNNETLSRALEPVLQKHRKAILYLNLEQRIEGSFNPRELPGMFKVAMADTRHFHRNFPTLVTFQSRIFNAIASGLLPASVLDTLAIPEDTKYIKLINNDMVFRYTQLGEKMDYARLHRYEELAKHHPEVLFNLYGLMVELWYRQPELIENAEAFRNKIEHLITSRKIHHGEYYKLLLNYHITAAEHYRTLRQFDLRDRSVNFIYQHYMQAKLDAQDAYVLANYFVYHGQSRRAATLLHPFTIVEDLDEDLLFYYLSLIIFDEYRADENEFVTAMEKARNMNRSRYCQLFGYPALTFQLLRQALLKNMYCRDCE